MNEQLLEPQSETRMEETAPAKPRLKLRNPLKGLRGKKKRWLLLLVVIAVAGGAVTVRLLSKLQTASAVTSYQEETVSQRDIVNSLSSSGTLQPADSYTVSTLVSGEILSDTFEEFAMPLAVGLIGALLMGCLCGAFNGTLVAYLNIQPMVATLILWSAARAIGLLLCNNLIVYVRVPEFGVFGGYIGPVPTPIIIAAVCVAVVSVVLKKTAMGMYIQSVGINRKASRIAGLNSKRIIFVCYLVCGLCAGIAGIVASSRITSADSNNIGLDMELDAILAVALGGNSLGGGRFNLAGSIIGAYTIQAITTTMLAMGVSTAVNPVFKAIVVIAIVAIQAPPVKAWFKKRSAAKAVARKEAVGV